jgi:hypothetical protein
MPGAERPVRVPLYPVIPLLFVLLELVIIYGAFQIEANRAAAWIGLFTIAISVVLFALRFRRAYR